MRILNRDVRTGWTTAVIGGRWVEAKVYDEPSDYGVNGGRVSKIAISKTRSRDPDQDFLEQMCYNYDRGLDFCREDMELVNKIVAQLETLPKLFS